MLTCTACGADNPGTAKFCHECGRPLAPSCAECGAVLTAAQRFCGECGAPQPVTSTPTPTAAAPPESPVSRAERRVCSVLFVDLVGFTPLSETRDAEDVRELLSAYFDRARTIVERYGGVIEKFIGDAVMAIWGTPMAVEGDAERAVRAGLDLVASVVQLGEEVGAADLQARAGVVTGDVAITVGAIGEGVAGDTVNTAARVQGAALPGAVWVDDLTERLTHAAIGYTDAGEHVLKGKAEPHHLWSATRVLSTVGGVQRVDGLEARMLGRDVELRLLKELFHSSVERRAARLVVVSGPAGIGKSRLGWEFEKYVDGLADEVLWHRGRCLSYGDGVAFWALADAVRQRLGIAEEDPPEVAGAKLRVGLELHLSDEAERDYVGVRLARLLGVTYVGASHADTASASALHREELFAGWRLFLERLAATRPVVLLLEDAQHADTGLLDFLDHLADWSRDAAVFVIVFARSELFESQPGWGVGRNRTGLSLDTLGGAAMDELVDALVPGMPAATRAAVAAQAQGIPLYAVETIRSLIDRDLVVPRDGHYRLVGDVSDLSVPETLRGLLAARFDALPPDLHALLADAAVLGSNFPADALAAVSCRDVAQAQRLLAELVRREILDVSADPLSPQRGFYAFSQNLLRQVVYDTLSRRDRKARHLAVATHLRSAFAHDGDEVIEVIAQHYVDALAAAPGDTDANPIREQAVLALVRGAARAGRAGSPRRAALALAAAAGLVGEDDAARAAELWSQAAEAASIGGQGELVVEFAGTAARLLEQQGDLRAAARARIQSAVEMTLMGRQMDGVRALAAAYEVLREPADRDTVLVLHRLARAQYFLDRAEDMQAYSREALRLAQDLGVDQALMSTVCNTRALALDSDGRHEEAVALFEHSVRLSGSADCDVPARFHANGLLNLADMLLTGDAERARVISVQSLELGRRLGIHAAVVGSLCNIAAADLWLGNWTAAEELLTGADQDGVADDAAVLQTRAMVAALRGDHALLRELRGLPTLDADDRQEAMYAGVIEAMAAAGAGDPARVVPAAQAAIRSSAGFSLRQEGFVWAWTLGHRATRELGDGRASAEFLAILDRHPNGAWPRLVVAERALARALDARSTSLAVEALAALRTAGSPFHLAHGLLDLATLADLDEDQAPRLVAEARALNESLRAPTLTRRLADTADPADVANAVDPVRAELDRPPHVVSA